MLILMISILNILKYYKQLEKKLYKYPRKNSFVDRINLGNHYKINENFLKKFDSIELNFEDILQKLNLIWLKKYQNLLIQNIVFYSNIYNQKSLEVLEILI